MMLLHFIALFAVIAAHKLPFDSELDGHWKIFKETYGKTYTSQEEIARRLIWEGNVNEIFHHNLAADMGMHSYKRGINEYSDMTPVEYLGKMTGLIHIPNLRSNGSVWLPSYNIKFPEKVDWREKGLVTSVKDQKKCGSCWAFSSTGALEGQHKKKTGKLVSLSEQNLIDCSRSEGNNGCNGGSMNLAFNYIKKNHGIDTEESYPYTAKDDGVCHFKKENVGATCTGFVYIPSSDENALMQAVATVGPIAAAIDANHREFFTYKSGIFDEPFCNSDLYNLQHAILVVGYGTENGKDYWLVKNSWGESWGMNGYIKMARNKNNQCGIATDASYPLV